MSIKLVIGISVFLFLFVGVIIGVLLERYYIGKKIVSSRSSESEVEICSVYLKRKNFPIAFNTIRDFLPLDSSYTTVGAVINDVVDQYDLNSVFLVAENVIAALLYLERRGGLEIDMGTDHNRVRKNSEIRLLNARLDSLGSEALRT